MKKLSTLGVVLTLLFPSVPLVGAALLGGAVVTTVLVVDAPSANAGSTNCYNNSFGVSCSGSGGTTNCYNNSFGYSCSGTGGTTNCYNNSFGVSCSGTNGTTNCYNNSFGYSCSGSGGTTNCYNNSFGTSCSGTNGTTNCYNNSFGVSCSGSGNGLIPSRTPSYTLPEPSIPSYTLPKTTVPSYTLPKTTVPSYSAPQSPSLNNYNSGDLSDVMNQLADLSAGLDSITTALEKTITCKKGTKTKTITDLNPKCPQGYSKK